MGITKKLGLASALGAAIACLATFGMSSSARADSCNTATGACSGGTGDAAWSVTISTGISLAGSWYFPPGGPGQPESSHDINLGSVDLGFRWGDSRYVC